MTAEKVEKFVCDPGRSQAFLWDADVRSLALRATAAGAKAYVFQGRVGGATTRITIGKPTDWPLDAARRRARELQQDADRGIDSRKSMAEAAAAIRLEREQARAAKVLVREAWVAYVADRRAGWGDRHHAEHLRMVKAGGETPKRGLKGGKVNLTKPGPLHALMDLTLPQLNDDAVKAWAKRHAATAPTQARLALRMLRAFLNWCADSRDFKDALPKQNPATNKAAHRVLGKPTAKTDVLEKGQLQAWFAAVRALPNPAHAAYLQTLLLVGCRPGELVGIRWTDINERWRALTIRDKVEGTRTIPMTPYVWSLLRALPRRNAYVFGSDRGASGHMTTPATVHAQACTVAGIGHLTLHGLRRSFASLSEWLEIPVGVVAQIQGHKPSATVERHYKVRPLDLLRVHHERFETWVLEHADVTFVPTPDRVSVVA